MRITFFGRLKEACNCEFYDVELCDDLIALKEKLGQQFPLLEKENFAIAINRTIITENKTLQETDEIALLPPFSGG